jgi:hypothetical protein
MTEGMIDVLARLRKLKVLAYKEDDEVYLSWCEIFPLIIPRMPWMEKLPAPDLTDEILLCSNFPESQNLNGVYQLTELYATGTLPRNASFPNLSAVFLKEPLENHRSLQDFASFDKPISSVPWPNALADSSAKSFSNPQSPDLPVTLPSFCRLRHRRRLQLLFDNVKL